jgi:hypothetical protein
MAKLSAPLASVVLAFVSSAVPSLAQQSGRSAPPDLAGVYQGVPNSKLPAGLKNSGSPSEISLLPTALEQAKKVNPKDDPWRMCQPVGPFLAPMPSAPKEAPILTCRFRWRIG